MHNMEYIKLYWKHNEKDTDPVAILYEVDIEEDRYAVRLINIFADRHTENQEDPAWGWVTEAPVPTAEEFNSYEYGEEFKAHLITKEHFEETWCGDIYPGALHYEEWKKGIFYNIDFLSGEVRWMETYLQEDMLQVHYPNNFLLDMGWYGGEKQFIIQIIKDDEWGVPVVQYITKKEDRLQELLLQAVNRVEKESKTARTGYGNLWKTEVIEG